MYILFFLFTIILGLYLLSFFPKTLPFLVKLSLVYLFGTLFLTVLFFLFYPLLAISEWFLYLPFGLLIPIFLLRRIVVCEQLRYMAGDARQLLTSFRGVASRASARDFDAAENCWQNWRAAGPAINFSDLLILLFSLSFSSFLFLKTVWYDFNTSQTLIMGKLWSDFGAHISLIRSFSSGFNFPPEYPLFANAPIKYYFLFHFHVALLEKFGLPLAFAINLPSIFSLTVLLLLIYCLTVLLFHRKLAGFLAVIFFLFNASFSWWYFVQKNFTTNMADLFKKLITLKEFPAFNPYDGSLISGGFWNLNVYTNQRHLAFSLALLFLVIYLFLWKRVTKEGFSSHAYFILGSALGILPFWHGVVFIIAALSIPLLFLIDQQKKKFFFLITLFILISLPLLFYLRSGTALESSGIKFLPGYLTAYNFTLFNFLRYWFLNLGLLTILAALGFLLAPKSSRLLFLFALPPFILGNLFSFSRDMATNHKFFNFSVIIFNMYAAYLITLLVTKGKTDDHLKQLCPRGGQTSRNIFGIGLADLSGQYTGKIVNPSWQKYTNLSLGIILIFFLTLSGFIDLFPILNDTYFGVPDSSHKPDILWLEKNTDKKAVFANSYYLFHPASLAGRRIILGWPYFSWSAGYDTETRVKDLTNLYLSTTKQGACYYIHKLKIDYVTLNLIIRDVNINFEEKFWRDNFPLLYQNPQSGLLNFEGKRDCDGL